MPYGEVISGANHSQNTDSVPNIEEIQELLWEVQSTKIINHKLTGIEAVKRALGNYPDYALEARTNPKGESGFTQVFLPNERSEGFYYGAAIVTRGIDTPVRGTGIELVGGRTVLIDHDNNIGIGVEGDIGLVHKSLPLDTGNDIPLIEQIRYSQPGETLQYSTDRQSSEG